MYSDEPDHEDMQLYRRCIEFEAQVLELNDNCLGMVTDCIEFENNYNMSGRISLWLDDFLVFDDQEVLVESGTRKLTLHPHLNSYDDKPIQFSKIR